MKKTILFFISILLILDLVYSDPSSDVEVFKTTKELTAYKEYVSSSSVPQQVILNFYSDSNYSQNIDDGNDLEITSRNTAVNAFYWRLTGNVFGQVQISFKFGPMYLGEMSRFGSLTTTELDRVIPYTVQLTHQRTDIGNKTNILVNSNATNATKNNYDSSQTITIGTTNYTLYLKYADNAVISGNNTKVSSSPITPTVTYNMSTRTSKRYNTNGNNYTAYTGTILTCDNWIRTGVCKVTLNLTNNGTWTDNGNTVTPLGGEYHAYVIVTLTTGT